MKLKKNNFGVSDLKYQGQCFRRQISNNWYNGIIGDGDTDTKTKGMIYSVKYDDGDVIDYVETSIIEGIKSYNDCYQHLPGSSTGCKNSKIPCFRKRSRSPPAIPRTVIKIVRDLYSTFCDINFTDLEKQNLNKLTNNSNFLKDQLIFFLCYTQTYFIDILHDFGTSTSAYRGNLLEKLMNDYRKFVIPVINIIGKEIIKNDGTKLVVTDIGLGENAEVYLDNNNIKQISYPNLYNVLNYLFPNFKRTTLPTDTIENSYDSWVTSMFEPYYSSISNNMLITDDNLIDTMSSILFKLNIKILPIQKFSHVMHIPALISINKKGSVDSGPIDKNIIFSADCSPDRAKLSYLYSLVDNLNNKRSSNIFNDFNRISLANTYDSGSTNITVLQGIPLDNNTENFEVNEFFTFRNLDNSIIKNYNIINYQLYKKKVFRTNPRNGKKTEGAGAELNLINFFGNSINYQNTVSSINFLSGEMVKNVTNTDMLLKLALCKTIGDKAKRDFLYSIKNTQYNGFENINIFLANDILSSMIATIDFQGSLIFTNKVIGNKGKYNEGVIYIGLRPGANKLIEWNNLIIEDFPLLANLPPNLELTYKQFNQIFEQNLQIQQLQLLPLNVLPPEATVRKALSELSNAFSILFGAVRRRSSEFYRESCVVQFGKKKNKIKDIDSDIKYLLK